MLAVSLNLPPVVGCPSESVGIYRSVVPVQSCVRGYRRPFLLDKSSLRQIQRLHPWWCQFGEVVCRRDKQSFSVIHFGSALIPFPNTLIALHKSQSTTRSSTLTHHTVPSTPENASRLYHRSYRACVVQDRCGPQRAMEFAATTYNTLPRFTGPACLVLPNPMPTAFQGLDLD